jgi:hypothetical protein
MPIRLLSPHPRRRFNFVRHHRRCVDLKRLTLLLYLEFSVSLEAYQASSGFLNSSFSRLLLVSKPTAQHELNSFM